jgi:putative toxin-antitoxin system antitoxin component (TIGR02293 family)
MPATARPARTRSAPPLYQVRTRLGLSQEALAQALGVSARTIVRWEGQTAVPSRLARDRLERLAEVVRLAEQIFPGPALASWLETPNPTLGDRTPLEVLATRGGLDEVYHLLGRLAWGIPT